MLRDSAQNIGECVIRPSHFGPSEVFSRIYEALSSLTRLVYKRSAERPPNLHNFLEPVWQFHTCPRFYHRNTGGALATINRRNRHNRGMSSMGRGIARHVFANYVQSHMRRSRAGERHRAASAWTARSWSKVCAALAAVYEFVRGASR